jgi:hypothetical protein
VPDAAQQQILLVAEVQAKRRSRDTRAREDFFHDDRVVTLLVDQRRQRSPQQVSGSVHWGVGFLRGGPESTTEGARPRTSSAFLSGIEQSIRVCASRAATQAAHWHPAACPTPPR